MLLWTLCCLLFPCFYCHSIVLLWPERLIPFSTCVYDDSKWTLNPYADSPLRAHTLRCPGCHQHPPPWPEQGWVIVWNRTRLLYRARFSNYLNHSHNAKINGCKSLIQAWWLCWLVHDMTDCSYQAYLIFQSFLGVVADFLLPEEQRHPGSRSPCCVFASWVSLLSPHNTPEHRWTDWLPTICRQFMPVSYHKRHLIITVNKAHKDTWSIVNWPGGQQVSLSPPVSLCVAGTAADCSQFCVVSVHWWICFAQFKGAELSLPNSRNNFQNLRKKCLIFESQQSFFSLTVCEIVVKNTSTHNTIMMLPLTQLLTWFQSSFSSLLIRTPGQHKCTKKKREEEENNSLVTLPNWPALILTSISLY